MNLCVCVHQKEVDDEIRKFKCSAESVTTVGVKRIERAPTELDQNSEKTTASPTTQKRYRLSLLQSARRAHGATEADDKPAVARLFDALIHTAAAPEQLLSV